MDRMQLVEYYRRQRAWRDWESAFAALPPLQGATVLDLGCGVGDQAAELVARGARVIGFDMNEEVVAAARSLGLAGAEFRVGDLRSLPGAEAAADGIWCSFGCAYFPGLVPVLASWGAALRAGGWIALTEIDDMFGHEPLSERAKSLFDSYARDALAAGRYDFAMGRKLRRHLEGAGFAVVAERTLADRELAFDGPARVDVLEAWRSRLEGMRLLREAFGEEYEPARDDFLACLARPDHRSLAKVVFCVATKK